MLDLRPLMFINHKISFRNRCCCWTFSEVESVPLQGFISIVSSNKLQDKGRQGGCKEALKREN